MRYIVVVTRKVIVHSVCCLMTSISTEIVRIIGDQLSSEDSNDSGSTLKNPHTKLDTDSDDLNVSYALIESLEAYNESLGVLIDVITEMMGRMETKGIAK